MHEHSSAAGSEPKDLPLKELCELEHMSVRAFNVCNNNGLDSLHSILDYYHQHGTFTKLRNAGRLTESELIGICQKYGPDNVTSDTDLQAERNNPVEETTATKWENVAPEHLQSVERLFKSRLDLLSARAQNFLGNIEPPVDGTFTAFDLFFSQPENRRTRPNAGRATIQELVTLRSDVIEFARTLHGGLNERVIFEGFMRSWCDRFGLSEKELRVYRQDFVVRRFPLFRFLSDLFAKGKGLGERDLLLMRHRQNYMLGTERTTLEELAAQLGLTRERVRQLAQGVPSRVRELVISLGPIFEFVNYEANYGRNRDLIIIDEEFASYINSREGVSFTALFYATVFESFLLDTHERIEEDFDGATDYLIRFDLTDVFDFEEYIRDLGQRLSVRVPETYTLDLSRHLKLFWRGDDATLFPRVSAVCELLAREEFGLRADDAGNPIIQRNTRRLIHEYIAEVLEQAERPLHVDEIYAILHARYPGLTSGPEGVRASMLRYDRFTRYEASSTYGLREWEQQYSHMKSGSFSDIAERILQESDRPLHIHDVADYVLQYRNTTRHNIVNTLRADSTRRFRFFPGGMIGLAVKDYADADLSFRPVSPRMYESLERLILDNGNNVGLSRLIDYAVLHYRMPEQQARDLFARLIAAGRLISADGIAVAVAATASSGEELLQAGQ